MPELYLWLRACHSAFRIPHSAFILFAVALISTSAGQEKPSRLPWESPPRVDEPIVRPPSGPAEIFERFDIGASQLQAFTSG